MSRQPSLGANSKAPVVAIALCFCSNPLQRLGSLATLALSHFLSDLIINGCSMMKFHVTYSLSAILVKETVH